MPTQSPSQAARTAELLTEANQRLVAVVTDLSDVLDITKEPDGTHVPKQEVLAILGLTANTERWAGWLTREIAEIKRQWLNQYDLSEEGEPDA